MSIANAAKIIAAVSLCAVLTVGCKDGGADESSSAEEKKAETSSVQAELDSELLSGFLGEWQARQSFAESDEWYTGYLHLYVLEDGKYSMYDNEAGNPGITGHFSDLTSDTVVLDDESGVDFDPPPNWQDMSRDQKIGYKFVSENELQLIYETDGQTWTLVFDRQ